VFKKDPIEHRRVQERKEFWGESFDEGKGPAIRLRRLEGYAEDGLLPSEGKGR